MRGKTKLVWTLGSLVLAAFMLCIPAFASATTGQELGALPRVDSLERTEENLSNGGKWSPLAWDTSTSAHKTGGVSSGWSPTDPYPAVNGAYWNQSAFSDETGDAATVKLMSVPSTVGQYASLWLDMPSPGTTKSGYELRWTKTTASSSYAVKLVKWSAGTETVLATLSQSLILFAGVELGIADTGGTISAWSGYEGAIGSELLSASDSTYSGGYAGLEGSGASREANFNAGRLLGRAVASTPLLDEFAREEVPLVGGSWTKLGWASEIGGSRLSNGGGYSSAAGLAGAAWTKAPFNTATTGGITAATLTGGQPGSGQYVSLWLDMPNPGSEHTGYEARFTSSWLWSTYAVELARWSGGTRTVLGSKSIEMPNGTTIALSDANNVLAVWSGTSPVVVANDATYSSGYAGIEVSGASGRYRNFRAGEITDHQPPDTTITSGPSGITQSSKVQFGFSSTEGGSSFACSLDGAAFAGCTSPQMYEGLSVGSHTFRVRATDAAGNEDLSPAERSFQVALPPTASYGPPQFGPHQVTLHATINPNGLATTYQFVYHTHTSSVESSPRVPETPQGIGSGTTPVKVSATITGLGPNATYDYHLIATNSAGTAAMEEETFTTPGMPVATTLPASGLTATEATLKANVNPSGDATSYYFEYGPLEGALTKVPVAPKEIEAGRAAVAVSETATGLTESQKYRYRVVATNSAGTVEGAFLPLNMLTRPTVTTEAAEAVEGTEAILTGTIEPHGQESTYLFEYGTTPSYGASVPSAEEEIGGGTTSVPTAEAVAELEPETTYHYRLVATSPAGKTAGVDQTFTTAPKTQKTQTPLPGGFYGLVWSGDLGQTAANGAESEMNVVKESGAKMFRLQLYQGHPENQIEAIFRMAANRGVRILPYFEVSWDPSAVSSTQAYIRQEVAKYGPNGTFWQGSGAGHYGGSNPAPVTWWEIGNEPNLGEHLPDPTVEYGYAGDPSSKINRIGNAFQSYSSAAKSAVREGGEIKILLPGLFTTSPTSCELKADETPGPCHISAADFIKRMNREGSYDGVSLHPYAFKVGGCEPEDGPECKKEAHAPENKDGQTNALVAKVRANIRTVRNAMVGVNAEKPIWVTELGFPVATGKEQVATFPPVDEPTQATLIEKAMTMLAEEHDALGIDHAFLWNIRDKEDEHWDWHCGLRDVKGHFKREAWKAFTGVTGGNQSFPHKPKAKVKGHKTKSGSHAADVSSLINPNGLDTKYWVKYGEGPISKAFGSFTNQVDAGAGYEDVEGTNTMTGLQPKTTYHLRVVAESEDGEEGKEESEDIEFTTPPSSSISQEVHRVLHGTNGGYFWVNGWVKEGAIEGSGPGLANVNVHLMLYRNGQYVGMREAHTDAAGHYESGFQSLGKGTYEVKAVFPGGLEWDEAVAPHPEEFTIRDGVQIVSRSAGTCMDVGGGSSANTAPVNAYPCLNPATAQNQVWTLTPAGEGYFEISARHSGKCLDISDVSQADGAALQQYDCLGANQGNQLFREVWHGNYVSYVAKHSGKCLDVPPGGGTPQLLQWTCVDGAAEQQFSLSPVESAPIPTETFLNIEQIIGNAPGYVTFSGHLKAGAYSMQGRVVHVIFEKNEGGNWNTQANVAMSVNAEGFYQYYDFGVGQGQWRARAVFAGGDVFAGTSSGEHYFTVQVADRIVSRASGKCMSLSNALHENVNGQHFILWDCSGSPSYGDGQVFRLWPSGGGHYEITVTSSGRCVDFADASTENGGVLQQWDCNHYPQQHFQLLPIAGQEGWYALRPEHDYKCLDVLGGREENGAAIGQYDCLWAGNQQWRLEGAM